MRRALRWVALGILAATVVLWVVGGAHRGWSKSSVKVTILDEITGIEQITYQDRFVAGVDTLAVGAAAAAALFGASFLIRRSAPPRN